MSAAPRNLTPDERDKVFGPLVVLGEVVGRDGVRFATPPGPPPLIDVQVGPHVVRVHELAAASLIAIADELEEAGLISLIEEIAGFQPRLVRTTGGGNKPVLSAHAYGSAVDVNWSSNPQGSRADEVLQELAPYFEGHGWYWGDRFESPDPHHFTFQGTDPTLAEGGLTCPVNLETWARDHMIAIVPGQIQHWLLGVTAPRDATDRDLDALVQSVFQFWAPLIPGRVQRPTVRRATPEQLEQAVAANTLEFGTPLHIVSATFGYAGEETAMLVPTFVRRRRERIEPTCPVPPFDVAPIVALEPTGPAEFGEAEAVEPRTSPLKDDLDLQLGPIDPDAIKRGLAQGLSALTTGLWVVGLGLGGLLVYQLLSSKKRGAAWS